MNEYEVTMRFWMADEDAARMVAKTIGDAMKTMQAARPLTGDRPMPVIRLAKILEGR